MPDPVPATTTTTEVTTTTRGTTNATGTTSGNGVAGRMSLLLITGVALAACVLAVVIGGAAAPTVAGLDDPGAFVRWGLPVVQVLHDIAVALTIGLLVLAATAIPDQSSGRTGRVVRAGRLAVGAGVAWVVSGLVIVVLGFADVSGTAPGDPSFVAQLESFAWSLETLRVEIISAGLALLATTLAALALTRRGIAVAAAVAIAAVLPLALGGHAAGSADHETAVTSIAFHLVGAVLWVGGLLALAVVRSTLGTALPVVVQRFSTLALWCFVAVGLSGVLNAWLRLGGVGNLLTAYGALILLKTSALLVLGGAGYLQRRRVVQRLRSEPGSGRLFTRLVLTELAVMGAAFGVAAALARTPAPDTDAPPPSSVAESLTGFPVPAAPDGMTWLTVWRWDWLWGTVAVLGILLYLRWALRLRRRGDRWPPTRTVNWVLGWLLFMWATCGAPGVYGRVAFSWHMVEHLAIAMAVPILLVLAAPVTLALRALAPRKDGTIGPRELVLALVHSPVLRRLGNPVVAAVVFFASLVAFYYSPLFGLALTTHTGHVLMISHFLLTGYLFAWALIGVDPGPPKWTPPLRLVILFATVSFHAFFGVALTSGTKLLAPDFFARLEIPWLPEPIRDQQLGGSIAWAVGELPTLALAMLVTLAWVRSDAAETRRTDRQAARDGDAELAAYNERLRALADADRRPGHTVPAAGDERRRLT